MTHAADRAPDDAPRERLEILFGDRDGRAVECGWPNYLKLVFEFPWDWPSTRGLLSGAAHIEQVNLHFKFAFLCFGWDVREFADSLERLHASYDGRAKFSNQEGSVELVLQVHDRGTGMIGADLRVERPEAVLGGLPTEYRWHSFGGFGVEQSFVPGVVRQIRDFLNSTGVSTIHPMHIRT